MVKKIIIASVVVVVMIVLIAFWNMSSKFRAGYVNFANKTSQTMHEAAGKIGIDLPVTIVVDGKGA